MLVLHEGRAVRGQAALLQSREHEEQVDAAQRDKKTRYVLPAKDDKNFISRIIRTFIEDMRT